jgi:hypothetical protein
MVLLVRLEPAPVQGPELVLGLAPARVLVQALELVSEPEWELVSARVLGSAVALAPALAPESERELVLALGPVLALAPEWVQAWEVERRKRRRQGYCALRISLRARARSRCIR